MTIDALPGKGRRSRSGPEHPTIAIGASDAQIFDCPACDRPLAVGTSRCPGCRTRLIGGIRATRAAGFIATGLMLGLIVGTAGTSGVFLLTRPLSAVVAEPVPSAAPLSSAGPIATAPPVEVPSGIPAAARSALRQSALIDARLIADGDRLRAALAARAPTAELARILRTMAANAAVGERVSPDLGRWSSAEVVASSLGAAYAAVGSTAASGTDYSLTNDRPYLDASRAMLGVVDDLAALDTELRGLAVEAEVDLPPVAP